ncbi:MAG: class I SAM-dependent methyltransferase [Pseudomonadota bacterium]
MKHDPKFWDRHAPGYAKRPISDMSAYEATLDRIRTYLTPDARVLELGCGTGGTALRLAEDAGAVLATDISEGMIEQAHKRPPAPNVTFRAADVFDPELKDRQFDVVLALNLMHLLPDMPEFLTQVRKKVAPGGLFISKTPCLSEPGLGLKFGLLKAAIPVMQLTGHAPFVEFFRVAALEAAIAQAGFEIIETGDYPKTPTNRFVVARAL